jgi:uncharacterized iron-regulated membrane protein
MKAFRFFWETHKWLGVGASVFVLLVSVTGFLLLVKKDYAWIQPPTQLGTERPLEGLLTMEQLWRVVEEQGHPDFATPDDIDRVDVRLGKFVYKVRSEHNYTEMQVDAGSGEVLSIETRRSDWIEQLHDGSLFGDTMHGWIMPILAVSLIYLVFSGLWLWLAPILRRRSRRRARARVVDSGQTRIPN